MTLEQLIKEKNDRLEAIPTRLLTQVEKTQKKIFTLILSELDAITKKNGLIEPTAANLAIVQDVTDKLKTALHGGEYAKAVKAYAEEFGTQAKINDQYFNKAFTDFSSPDISKEILTTTRKEAVELLIGSPLDEGFLRPAEKLLNDLVLSGSAWVDSVQAIRDFAEGTDEVDGKLLQYSKQIAHDAFSYSDRAYTNAAADEVEAEWYFYSGGEIPTTRCFCEERNGQYFHYKEIEAWGRGEKLGRCKSGEFWAGANKKTNPQTIFLYAGGYNCMHSIMPISVFDVPKPVIERNIRAGNYEPTDFEVEELGL